MSIIDALEFLHRELKQEGIDGAFVLELEQDDGPRFHVWALNDPHIRPTMFLQAGHWGRTIDRDTKNPKREIDVGPYKVRWPITLVALPNGRTAPEPPPVAVATIGADGEVVITERVTRIRP